MAVLENVQLTLTNPDGGETVADKSLASTNPGECEQTSANSVPACVNKEIRRRYSNKQKQRVVEYAKHHGVRPAGRKFNIARKNVQRWLKELKDTNPLFPKASKRRRCKRCKRGNAGRKLSYPQEVDESLLEWLLCMRERHLCVSTQMLRDKA